MSLCTLVSYFPLEVLILISDLVIIVVQFVVLLLQVQLVPMRNLIVCSVLFIAICLNLKTVVFVVQVVQPDLLLLNFTFEVIDSVLLVVEVGIFDSVFFICVDLLQVDRQVVQDAFDLVEMSTPVFHMVSQFGLDVGAVRTR